MHYNHIHVSTIIYCIRITLEGPCKIGHPNNIPGSPSTATTDFRSLTAKDLVFMRAATRGLFRAFAQARSLGACPSSARRPLGC